MTGMEGLGRIYNVVPIAAGVGISLKHCSGITFVCTNSAINAVFTVTVAPTFAGTYVAPTSSGGIISHYYHATSQNGSTGVPKGSQTTAKPATPPPSGAKTVIRKSVPTLPPPHPSPPPPTPSAA